MTFALISWAGFYLLLVLFYVIIFFVGFSQERRKRKVRKLSGEIIDTINYDE